MGRAGAEARTLGASGPPIVRLGGGTGRGPISGVAFVSVAGGAMTLVQIKCPRSGLWAWTDVRVDPQRWDPSSQEGRELACGICGERHLASSRALRVPPWSETELASSSA
jgi:hypothetical protein